MTWFRKNKAHDLSADTIIHNLTQTQRSREELDKAVSKGGGVVTDGNGERYLVIDAKQAVALKNDYSKRKTGHTVPK